MLSFYPWPSTLMMTLLSQSRADIKLKLHGEVSLWFIYFILPLCLWKIRLWESYLCSTRQMAFCSSSATLVLPQCLLTCHGMATSSLWQGARDALPAPRAGDRQTPKPAHPWLFPHPPLQEKISFLEVFVWAWKILSKINPFYKHSKLLIPQMLRTFTAEKCSVEKVSYC